MDYVIVDVICINVPVLTSEDKALINVLRVVNGWNVDRNDAWVSCKTVEETKVA